MVLVHDTSSCRGLQVYQVSVKNLQRFSSYRADTICDGQTDGQTDARGKTICLPTLKGGDIIKHQSNGHVAGIVSYIAYLMYSLLSCSPRVKSPSYTWSLNAMPRGERRSLMAGMLAPPVSGIHHCL